MTTPPDVYRTLLHRPSIIAAVTLAVLTVVNYAHEILSSISAYQALHRTYPFYFAESVDKIAGVVLCCLAVWLMRRTGLQGICRELGLSNISATATAFGVGLSLPMLLGFAIFRSLTAHIDPLALLFLTLAHYQGPLARLFRPDGVGTPGAIQPSYSLW